MRAWCEPTSTKLWLCLLQVSQTVLRSQQRTQIAIPAQGMIEFRDALTDLLDEFGTDDHGQCPHLYTHSNTATLCGVSRGILLVWPLNWGQNCESGNSLGPLWSYTHFIQKPTVLYNRGKYTYATKNLSRFYHSYVDKSV